MAATIPRVDLQVTVRTKLCIGLPSLRRLNGIVIFTLRCDDRHARMRNALTGLRYQVDNA
jgi:hypothetical protein